MGCRVWQLEQFCDAIHPPRSLKHPFGSRIGKGMTAISPPRIAVAGSTPVAETLRTLGFDVLASTDVSFGTFTSELQAGGAFRAVLAVTSTQMASVAQDLLDAASAGSVPTVLVHLPDGPLDSYGGEATDLFAPLTLNELLAAMGFETAGEFGNDELTLASPVSAPEPAPLPTPRAEQSLKLPLAKPRSAAPNLEPAAAEIAGSAPHAPAPDATPTQQEPPVLPTPEPAEPEGPWPAARFEAPPAALRPAELAQQSFEVPQEDIHPPHAQTPQVVEFSEPAVQFPEYRSAPAPMAPAVPTPVPVQTPAVGPNPLTQSWLEPEIADVHYPVHAAPVSVEAPAAAVRHVESPPPTTTAFPDPSYAADPLSDLRPDLLQRTQHSGGRGSADVILVLAWKGGVSKTTSSFALALMASEAGIGRVLLIDGNRGQGGIRSLLRVHEGAPLPTVHDLAYSNISPEDVIISPEEMNSQRPQMKPVKFHTVLNPPVAEGNSRDTPAELYTKVIEYARHRFDVVIVDTQTLDAESSDLFDGTFIPTLRAGAWGLALTDSSRESISNLPVLLSRLSDDGVRPARMLFGATLWKSEFNEEMAERYSEHFAGHATFVGSTLDDADFSADLATGYVDIESPVVRPFLSSVLHTVTGMDQFAPVIKEDDSRRGRRRGGRKTRDGQQQQRGKRGWWGSK